MEAERRTWSVARLAAPVYTVCLLLMVVLGTAALGVGAAPPGPDRPTVEPVPDAAFVDSVGWLTWRVVASLAIAVFVALFVRGLWMVRRRAEYALPATRERAWAYAVIAILIVLAGIAGIVIGGGRNPDIPVVHLAWRTRAVLFTGLASAVPWFVIAWLCQDRCRPRQYRPWTVSTDEDLLSFEQLIKLWSVLVACVGTFAIGVTGALITAGALRFAFLEAHPECNPGYDPVKNTPPGLTCVNDFPAVNVLLYGAVFAIVGLLVTIPLVAAWRSQAQARLPAIGGKPDEKPSKEWVDEHSRLSALLHLDTPILRNPLTVLSVFTPLVTSLFAAFLPQLG